jgi:hypothetical protein
MDRAARWVVSIVTGMVSSALGWANFLWASLNAIWTGIKNTVSATWSALWNTLVDTARSRFDNIVDWGHWL